MSAARRSYLLLGPLVSEKASRVAETDRQIGFRVRRDATKPEIRKAVEELFDVEVAEVTTLNQRGKRRAKGARKFQRADWKKAYVKLKPGHDIDFVGVE